MQKFVVHESSMRPALEPGDRVLAWRRAPAAGDVVVFPEPGGDRWFVKRLVAVAGAVVDIEDSVLTITHPQGERSRWALPRPEPDRGWTVGPGHGFVLSDALEVTRADSRVFGPVAMDRMLTVGLRYAPLRRMACRL